MKLKEYDDMMYNIRTIKAADKNIFFSLMLLLEDAKDVLFPRGKYKDLKWYQFERIWKLAKLCIQFITTLIAIFK